MNTFRSIVAVAVFTTSALASAADGLIAIKSPYDPKETMDRLQTVVIEHGLNVFARIDHAAGAEKVGESLRPTEVLIFGNPRGGTPFIECAQSVGIDLPLKALVWEDAQSQSWVGYNDPAYLAERHEVESCGVVPTLQNTLKSIGNATVAD